MINKKIIFCNDIQQCIKDICSLQLITDNLYNKNKEGCKKSDLNALNNLVSLNIVNLDKYIIESQTDDRIYEQLKKLIKICIFLIQTRYYKNITIYINNTFDVLNNEKILNLLNIIKFSGCSKKIILKSDLNE